MRNYKSTALEIQIQAFRNYLTVISTDWQYRDYRRRGKREIFWHFVINYSGL